MSSREIMDGVLPLTKLLLGVAAAGSTIDEVVAEDDGPVRVPVRSPVVRLLLGVVALRERLDRQLPSSTPSATARHVDPLEGILR